MNRRAYEQLPGIRWSRLKLMRRSPLHYHDPPEIPDGDALALGTATHVATLEPHRYDVEIAVWTGGTRRGKAWEEFVAEAEARMQTVVTATMRARARAIAAAVRAHPIAGPLLASGVAEMPVRWQDADTGLECKALVDWQITDGRTFLDLKTAGRGIDEHTFAATAWRLGYYHQIAFYRRGLAARAGVAPESLRGLLVAVESAPPHDVAVYEPDADSLAAADCEVSALLSMVRQCTDAGTWPGAHVGGVKVLRAPVWAIDAEGEDDFGLVDEAA